jgi:hypothetical protein
VFFLQSNAELYVFYVIMDQLLQSTTLVKDNIMKKLPRTIYAIALGMGLSMSAQAGTYTYLDKQIKLDISDGTVIASSCEMKDGELITDSCKQSSSDIKSLVEKLQSRVDDSDVMLKDEAALLALAKEMANADDADKFSDTASGVEYVMLSLVPGFNLPMDMEVVKLGDFSFVVDALTSHRDRYNRVIAQLGKEEMPKSFSSEKYTEVIELIEVENVVRVAEYL